MQAGHGLGRRLAVLASEGEKCFVGCGLTIRSIVADAKPEVLSLTYLHIDLDTHEAILAEGLAVESFQRDNPHAFDNADEYVRLYGSPKPLVPFAPIVSCKSSALAPLYDFRKPIEKVRDHIVDRLEFARAA